MDDVLIGLVACLVGVLLCVRGYVAMRIVIALWGAFAGFVLGAGAVASITGESFLGSVLAWSVGVAVAVLFGLLAYLYYEVSVLLAMSAIGFTLGATLMAALGVTWSWLVIVVGVILGIVVAGLAIMVDLPMVLLTLVTALAGASIVVTGALLVVGELSLGDLTSPATTQQVAADWWWYVLHVALVVLGIVVQSRDTARRRSTLRERWAGADATEVRPA